MTFATYFNEKLNIFLVNLDFLAKYVGFAVVFHLVKLPKRGLFLLFLAVFGLQRMVGTYHPNRVVNEDHTVSAAHGNTETIDKEELQKALDEQHSTQQNAQ